VFVVGDLAWRQDEGEQPVPALAPAASQMGRHAARNIVRQLKGQPLAPFRYLDKGSLATIGRSRAVGQIGRLQLSGLVAWLGWLFVHLLFLVGFRNRLVVLFEWAWAYLTYQRSSRIIVSPEDYAVDAVPTVLPIAPVRSDVTRAERAS
jgi:NADH dehydrogenase